MTRKVCKAHVYKRIVVQLKGGLTLILGAWDTTTTPTPLDYIEFNFNSQKIEASLVTVKPRQVVYRQIIAPKNLKRFNEGQR